MFVIHWAMRLGLTGILHVDLIGTIGHVELCLSLRRLDRRGEGVDVVGACWRRPLMTNVGVSATPLEPAESTSSATRSAPTSRRRSSRNRSRSVRGRHQVNRPHSS